MKVAVVTGGRKWRDYSSLARALGEYRPNLIVQGGANGADSLAREYAQNNCVTLMTFHANWPKHGKAAGPMRNEQMLAWARSYVDLTRSVYAEPSDLRLFAFPGGLGTTNCIETAKLFDIPTAIYPR